jgi:hypothetical protein
MPSPLPEKAHHQWKGQHEESAWKNAQDQRAQHLDWRFQSEFLGSREAFMQPLIGLSP